MIDTKESYLDELLERNNVTINDFIDETYKCMLISIFETLINEMNDPEVKKEIKQRYLSSSNKIITTQRLVNEKTKCKLSMQESAIIYEYMYAFFTKKNNRISYDDSIRFKLLQRQNNKCNICNKSIENSSSELDHIVPWALVGDELGLDNLQMLCRDCNRRKSKSAAYNLKMFLVNK